MNYEQEYNASLEQAKKELKTCGTLDCDAAKLIFRLFPQLRKEEKPLTPFQQCLNCILRGVYYAEVPDEKVNEFILNVVRTRTDELIKLAKRHEYADCQLHESEDERIRKGLIEALKTSKTVGELKFILPESTREECIAYLEKQKGQKHPNGCFTCDEYKKGYEAGRLNGFTAGYNKARKEQKPWKVGANAYFTPEQKPHRVAVDTCEAIDKVREFDEQMEKEQKPAEWSEEDEKMLVHVVELLELNCDFSEINNEISWLKSLSRKKIWNKEDERILKGIVGLIDHNQHYDVSNKDMLNWLKSLRPQLKEDCNYITPNKEFFQWIYDRLIHVHKENPDMDYMRSFKERIDNLSFEDKRHCS